MTTDQTNFFDQAAEPGPLPQLNPPAPAKRAFFYDGTYFEDPGPDYSTQAVLDLLARTYPELEGGTWTSRTLPDGSEEITFVKVTGDKGGTPPHTGQGSTRGHP